LRNTKYPLKVANDIIMLLDTVFGKNRYPVNIKELAIDYSKERFPDHFIKEIKGDNLPMFEGALYGNYRDNKSRWLIIYNNSMIASRINFTLAHEFGHYLLHRHEKPAFECSAVDVGRLTDEIEREAEANEFASQLLMPPHDFRSQINDQEISFDLIDHITNRYQVSLTAAVLQWIKITSKRAVLIVSRDGYILWSCSSEPAFKSGVYFKIANMPPVPLPDFSYASQRRITIDNKAEIQHKEGIWWKNEPVKEMTMFSDKYDLTISLLLFPDYPPITAYANKL
jgi:Zn-dependent peptidase ImmA (M78 family)